MKKRNRLKRAVVSVLLAVMLLSIMGTAVFAAASKDYSKPGSVDKSEYTSADTLSAILGEDVFGAEREYLELYADLAITHAANIPSSQVTVGEYTPGAGFTVKAECYSYVAENGVTVTFIPETASINNASFAFTPIGTGDYIAQIDSSCYDENGRVRVTYVTDVEISASEANSLINMAHEDAIIWKEAILNKKNEYEAAKEQYDADILAYNDYIEKLAVYEAALAEYEDYVFRKASYDRRLAEYNEYLSEYSEYNEALARYEQYLIDLERYNDDYEAYKEYIYVKDNFDELQRKYEKYLADISLVRYQLTIIDGLKKTSTSLNRSIYSSVIIGSTVTEVIAQRDLIANQASGIDPKIVDLAGESTEILRGLCSKYFSLKSETDKYINYALNYESFRLNFTNLFITLDKMYTNSKVRLALRDQGMQEKYEILLAQLFYVVNALNDAPVYNYDKTAVYDSKYVVNSLTKATPLSLLEGVAYMTDENSATPLATGYPIEAKKPSYTEVSEPQLPEFVAEPAEPYPVEDPGDAPSEVDDPRDGKPTEVRDPGSPPVAYVPPEAVKKLVEAYDRNELRSRPEVSSSVIIKHRIEVLKALGTVDFFTVRFLDQNGNQFCDDLYVENGTYADFPGSTPTRPSDDAADYEFLYWVDSHGNRFDLGKVESNLTLYPFFAVHKKSYSVLWQVDGNVWREERYFYGDTPTLPEDLKKADDDDYSYEIIGWQDEFGNDVSAVEKNVKYVAIIKKIPVFSTMNGHTVKTQRDENGILLDCESVGESCFNIQHLLTRVSRNDFITIKSRDCSVVLSPEALEVMRGMQVAYVDISTKIARAGYEITASFLDSSLSDITSPVQRSLVPTDVRITLSKANLSFVNPDAIAFYYLEEGRRKLVKATYSDGVLVAPIVVGRVYYLIEEYAINTISSGDLILKAPSAAVSGATVSVEISSLPKGAVLDRLYYIDSTGDRITIENGRFVMPSQSVLIGAEYHVPTFVITFVADGKIILQAEYMLGDTVIPPPVPEKAKDSKYYYTHGFWMPDISVVTGDATYEARYIPNEIIVEEKEGLQISPAVLHKLATVALIAFYALVLVTLMPIVIIKAARRRRRRAH